MILYFVELINSEILDSKKKSLKIILKIKFSKNFSNYFLIKYNKLSFEIVMIQNLEKQIKFCCY